ncbi:hypothetical protein RD792_015496 [Penstemon davidsonii]|uniref:ATP-dependent RNA helicase n=1 Tax=Penstemon davidsonii TaxID=160366 RepID=A0ABR0CHI6_9LAMI|nr:hypothetical protein RD792_015496 [Penstemon davidsonii]
MPTKLLPFQPIFRPILLRVFPHKLKFHSFGAPYVQRRLLLTRALAQNSDSIGMSKFSTRSGTRAVPSKSLIEDEAELSDWVSGLSSKSFKNTRLYSDSENDEGGNAGSGRFRGREGAGRTRTDSEFTGRRGGGARSSNNFDSSSRRGGDRDSSEPFPESRRSENDSNGGRGRGSEFSRGGRLGGRVERRDSSEPFSGRRKNENDFNGGSFGGRGRGRGSGESSRGGRFGGRLEEKRRSNDGYLSRGNEGRGEKKWGERGLENRNRNGSDRGGLTMKRGGKVIGQRGFLVTDDDEVTEDTEEEEQDRGHVSFKELIDSDEVDDDDEEEEEEEEEEEKEDENDDGLFEKESVVFQKPHSSSSEKSDSYLSESRFDQCSISPLSLKGIKDAGYERMTMVQEATLPLILKGKDVLAKAKTGTGKTVAFLLPAIELIVKSPPIARDQRLPPIHVLVICPTRELASQAAAEAKTLLKYHTSIGVQVVIGGTRLALEQKRMQANPCQILVATPGRLTDHVENTAGFATRLMGVKVLVLDEADHLLDMGFRKAIERIIAAVPKQRQTLLFSATIAQEVIFISFYVFSIFCWCIFTRASHTISCMLNQQVRQTHLIAPLDKHFSLLYTMLKDHIADDVNYKILVFCTTAMVTRLVASLLGELNLNVREIHSRKPQSYRTRISDEFRKSKGLILVTSDVSARGVDYPDVTLVIQIGVPADRQQYIHRLGRTGRKGKEGQGILMLAPWEEFFLSNIKDLPISKAPDLLVDPDTRKKVELALSRVEMKNKEAAYQAWLGYYNSNKNVGRDKSRLVELANEFSRSMCLDNPPAIPKLVLGKMGLKNVPGLRSK